MANDTTTLIPVPVHRHTLFVANAVAPYVPLRPICELLGIDWKSQYSKLREHPTFTPTVVEITTVAGDGKLRSMVCIPADLVMGWLMMVHPNKVSPRARDTLIIFQREASRLLYEAWWSARHGLPTVAGKPSGNLLEAVEGPPPLRSHPAVAWAIAMSLEAGRDIAQAFRDARAKQRQARQEAARAGISSRELRILVERERWNAQRPSNDSPLFDA